MRTRQNSNSPELELTRTQKSRTHLRSGCVLGPCVLLRSGIPAFWPELTLRSGCVLGPCVLLRSAFSCVLARTQILRSAFRTPAFCCVLGSCVLLRSAFCCVLASCVLLRSALCCLPGSGIRTAQAKFRPGLRTNSNNSNLSPPFFGAAARGTEN